MRPGISAKIDASVPPAVVPLSKTRNSESSPGRRDTRFTSPATAPAPYKVDAGPLMISTRSRSSGGVCRSPNPPESPSYKGNPSFRTCVKRRSKPCIRIPASPKNEDSWRMVMPVISLRSMRMSPGRMFPFSTNSSPAMISTRVGMSWIVRVERVVEITTPSMSTLSVSDVAKTDAGSIKPTRKRPARLIVRRGSSCISCPIRMGRDRCGRLWVPRAPEPPWAHSRR